MSLAHTATRSVLRLAIVRTAAIYALASIAGAQVTITTCSASFGGEDMAVNKHFPHDAFVTSGPVVKHIASVRPCKHACNFANLLPDITLGPGITATAGVALDSFKNLYVAAGSDGFAITGIFVLSPPYTDPPTVFQTGVNFRGVAIYDDILYAADFGAGELLRFDLSEGPHSVEVMTKVPGIWGIFAEALDDLFVTSNAGYTGVASGVGSNSVLHVRKIRKNWRCHPGKPFIRISTIASGLSFPEGIGGDQENLFIAAQTVVFTVPITGGTPKFYTGLAYQASQGISIFRKAGYVINSSSIDKFTLP